MPGRERPPALITRTLQNRNNIPRLTGDAGEPAAARDLFRALLDMERVPAPDHPDTLTTRNNIAAWTGSAGESAAARDLFRALLPDMERVLGPGSPGHPHNPQQHRVLGPVARASLPRRAICSAPCCPIYGARPRPRSPEHPLRTCNNIAAWDR